MSSRHARPRCVLVYRLLRSLAMLSSMLDDALGMGLARLRADRWGLGPSLVDGPFSRSETVQVCSFDASGLKEG